MRENPRQNEIYKHFKGNFYQVTAVAEHTETREGLVIYRTLSGAERFYARPITMFMSEVDKIKYPEVKQQFRFELWKPEATVEISAENIWNQTTETKDKDIALENKSTDAVSTDLDDDEVIHPSLLKFLESDTYEEKLDTLIRIKKDVDDNMINTIAMSLDIEVPEGALEEKYNSVKTCLVTLEKYECNRLR